MKTQWICSFLNIYKLTYISCSGADLFMRLQECTTFPTQLKWIVEVEVAIVKNIQAEQESAVVTELFTKDARHF